MGGVAGRWKPQSVVVSRSSARNPNRGGWSPLLPQLHGVPPWGDEKKAAAHQGRRPFFSYGFVFLQEALHTPSVDKGE